MAPPAPANSTGPPLDGSPKNSTGLHRTAPPPTPLDGSPPTPQRAPSTPRVSAGWLPRLPPTPLGLRWMAPPKTPLGSTGRLPRQLHWTAPRQLRSAPHQLHGSPLDGSPGSRQLHWASAGWLPQKLHWAPPDGSPANSTGRLPANSAARPVNCTGLRWMAPPAPANSTGPPLDGSPKNSTGLHRTAPPTTALGLRWMAPPKSPLGSTGRLPQQLHWAPPD